MGSFSWALASWSVVFLLLFGGRGKISELMGDFAQGIKSFKKGMQEDDTAKSEPTPRSAKTIDHQSTDARQAPTSSGAAETSSSSEG